MKVIQSLNYNLGFYESSSESLKCGKLGIFLKIVPSLNCNWTLFMTTYHPSFTDKAFTDKDLPSILYGQGLTIHPSWCVGGGNGV